MWFYCGFGLHAAFGLWVYVGLVVFRVMILLLFGDLLFWVCVQHGLWWLWVVVGFRLWVCLLSWCLLWVLFIVINSVDTVFLRMLWLLFVVGLIVTYTYS